MCTKSTQQNHEQAYTNLQHKVFKRFTFLNCKFIFHFHSLQQSPFIANTIELLKVYSIVVTSNKGNH